MPGAIFQRASVLMRSSVVNRAVLPKNGHLTDKCTNGQLPWVEMALRFPAQGQPPPSLSPAPPYDGSMQILTRTLLILGLVLLVAGAVLLGKNVIDINQLHAVASANRSTSFFNPVYEVLIGAALALVSGFVLGVGSGLARRGRVEG